MGWEEGVISSPRAVAVNLKALVSLPWEPEARWDGCQVWCFRQLSAVSSPSCHWHGILPPHCISFRNPHKGSFGTSRPGWLESEGGRGIGKMGFGCLVLLDSGILWWLSVFRKDSGKFRVCFLKMYAQSGRMFLGWVLWCEGLSIHIPYSSTCFGSPSCQASFLLMCLGSGGSWSLLPTRETQKKFQLPRPIYGDHSGSESADKNLFLSLFISLSHSPSCFAFQTCLQKEEDSLK